MFFIQAIITIWQREVIRYLRDKIRIISTLFQPIMFLFIFGMGLQETLAGGNFSMDFIQFMYPGIIAINVMGVAFFSTISTVWDREFGFLKEILVAPVSRTAIVLGKVLGATTVAVLQALILLIIAPFISVNLSFIIVLKLFFSMALLAFSISCLSLLIASLMTTMESFGLLMQVLIFPMFFLSGAFFPLKNVPLWMTVLSKINPLTYGVDAFRQIILGPQVSAEVINSVALHSVSTNTLFLIIFSFIMVTIAVLTFDRNS
ncbi:ABC transporter permease [Patescibacteria group bacterium]|nr:ABC transporter permease [Patescibacteria group bacterium]MBU2472517.1 ABC transporter permease [Patescibacteria group bacterium]